MDTAKLRELLDRKAAIETEIIELVNGSGVTLTNKPTRKPHVCSTCGEPGHTARNCDKQQELPT